MKYVKLVGVFTLLIGGFVHADMMKCVIKNNPTVITNYFDSADSKEKAKCKSKPVTVVTSSGQKIKNRYRNSDNNNTKKKQKKSTLLAAKDVKPMSCGGSGGTVKVNGKIFHLDADALCKKYGSKSRGSITNGIAKHVKLNHVDVHFRKKISPYVNKIAKKYGMEPEFVHAIISAESAYKPNATSHAGAMGLMQLMPFTAKRFGVSNAYNPHKNIEAGTKYLKMLYDEFGSLELAAAGYNAGEGAVRKYNRSIPPYKETRRYVPKVMAYYRQYKRNRSLIALK